MSKKVEDEVKEAGGEDEGKKKETIISNLYEITRKILLAGVGAAAIAQEEVDSFVGHLAKRGEIAEKDARRLVKEVLDKREKLESEKKSERDSKYPPAATKADIEALAARVGELSKKIDELKNS
jgi:polyhydroxyalkanoate synthesis regulator phasin